jgi:hypothetical protein
MLAGNSARSRSHGPTPARAKAAFKLTPHQQQEAIKRADREEETLVEIGRSYNVSAATISRLMP